MTARRSDKQLRADLWWSTKAAFWTTLAAAALAAVIFNMI